MSSSLIHLAPVYMSWGRLDAKRSLRHMLQKISANIKRMGALRVRKWSHWYPYPTSTS